MTALPNWNTSCHVVSSPGYVMTHAGRCIMRRSRQNHHGADVGSCYVCGPHPRLL